MIDKTNKKKKKSTTSSRKNDLVKNIIADKKTISKNVKNISSSLTDEDKQKIFAPPIRDNNNILIRLIKTKLKELQIPEKQLAKKFDNTSEYNNFKRALVIRDSITIEGFGRWMEVLDLDWKIKITPHK